MIILLLGMCVQFIPSLVDALHYTSFHLIVAV